MRRSGVSGTYRQVLEKVHWSHQHGRDVFHLSQADIDLARLFAYGYRAQTIGTFHATRTAVENALGSISNSEAHAHLTRSLSLLAQLEDEAMQAIPQDFRAAMSTLYRYDQWTNQALEFMQMALVCQRTAELESIGDSFLSSLNSVTGGNGLYLAADTRIPRQGAFEVPNLGITIVPLIYGDFHSWNFAYLSGGQYGVPVHRHRAGVEIHLGLSPVNGSTILGRRAVEVREGYAMPIPPAVDHGFHNQSGHDHILPFVFGSLARGGWGVFFDVEPRQEVTSEIGSAELETREMNHSVWLDRTVARIEQSANNARETVIPARRTSTPETGGLELSAARITDGAELTSNSFRIVSIVRGRARVRVGDAEAEAGEHEYFGVPANLHATIAQVGDKPLVTLDSLILPHVLADEIPEEPDSFGRSTPERRSARVAK